MNRNFAFRCRVFCLALFLLPICLTAQERKIIYGKDQSAPIPQTAEKKIVRASDVMQAEPGSTEQKIIYGNDKSAQKDMGPLEKRVIYSRDIDTPAKSSTQEKQVIYSNAFAEPVGTELLPGGGTVVRFDKKYPAALYQGYTLSNKGSPTTLATGCDQFEASASQVVPTGCPRSSAGYAHNGSFTIAVSDGACTGTYTVNAAPVANSAPGGSTPPLTIVTTYIGFPEGNFFFGNAGAGQYLLTVTNTSGGCAKVENPITFTVTVPEGSPSAACDVQNPNQFTAAASQVLPTSCPRSAAGYAHNGSFTVAVSDGPCTGTYTVNAAPVANSAPGGTTPPLTIVTTYIGFPEGNFFFGNAGAGQYLLTVTNTSGGCAQVQNPVTFTVTVPEGSPSAACNVQNSNQFVASANSIVPTGCPRSSAGYAHNGSFVVGVSDGACTGAYTVDAAPVANSGPGGTTPPLTIVTTYIGFPEGSFFFGNAGAGQYLLTVTNTSGGCAPVQNPVTFTVTVPEGSPSAACDVQNPNQFVASASTVVPTGCPRSSAGYAHNGSFTVAVSDGACTGTYTVDAAPVANSGPGGTTPPLTIVTTYIGFPEGNFFFGNAGAGQYLLTVTNTSGGCAQVQNPITFTVTVPEGSPSAACDVQNPNQFVASASTVVPTGCPRSSAGYAHNGSFTVAVSDGACTGTYTVNAAPVANSGPGGTTPPLTIVTTYIGFPEGNFFFGNAGAGQYLLTVTNTSGGCAQVQNPVTFTVTVPEGSPSAACDVQNPNQFTAAASQVVPTSCPRLNAGYAHNGSFVITVSDGPCTGVYMVNATPVANSGPGGKTPPLTTVTTYIGFPEGNFFFGNAGAGQYLLTVTNTSGGCAQVQNPVTFTVTVPEGITPQVNAVPNMNVCPGTLSTAVMFTTTTPGAEFYWTNDKPAIGLAANGIGNIPAFVALNPGVTPITATITVTPAYNNNGCLCLGIPIQFTITVGDKLAPVISAVSATPNVLDPPNHKLVDVLLNYTVTDNGPFTNTIMVTSNEPINGPGDGNTEPDWKVIDDHHIQLRAERAGKGNGRTYTIKVTSTDACGYSSSKTVTVFVPKGNAKRDAVENLEITVKPNPSISDFLVMVTSTNKEQMVWVKVTDIAGRLVETRKVSEGELFRLGDRYAKGMYILQVKQGDQTLQYKLFKGVE